MRKTVQITSRIKKEYPNLRLSDNSIFLLEKYLNLLIMWNKKINLTAIREEDAIIVKHLMDSIVALTVGPMNKLNLLSSGRIIDLGSGAGIPGIILAICKPLLHVVSLDKSKNKIGFQSQVVRQLELKNVQPMQIRLEEFAVIKENDQAYDVIISRAFDQIKNILYFTDQLLKPRGYVMLWKGEKWEEEMSEVQDELKNNYRLLHTHRYQFSEFNHGGLILLFQKLNPRKI